jgi:hypothetical protein
MIATIIGAIVAMAVSATVLGLYSSIGQARGFCQSEYMSLVKGKGLNDLLIMKKKVEGSCVEEIVNQEIAKRKEEENLPAQRNVRTDHSY